MGTGLKHDKQSRVRPLSRLQVVRVDSVHTQRYLGAKTLNPRIFSFQSEVFGFWFLSICFDELKYVYFYIVYAPVIFGIEVARDFMVQLLVTDQVEM